MEIVNLNCRHLDDEHPAIAGYINVRADFPVKDKSELDTGTEGTCRSSQLKDGECDHSCGLITVACVWYGRPGADIEPLPAVEPDK